MTGRILKKLGKRGMHEAYVAEDTKLGRQAALKALLPEAIGRMERKHTDFVEARVSVHLFHRRRSR